MESSKSTLTLSNNDKIREIILTQVLTRKEAILKKHPGAVVTVEISDAAIELYMKSEDHKKMLANETYKFK